MRQRAEEEDLGLKAEEARLKSEAQEQERLKAEEEARIAEELRLKTEVKEQEAQIVKDASQEAKDHEHAQLKE